MKEQPQQPDGLQDSLDEATSRRLGKLGALPIDVSSLASKLDRALSRVEAPTTNRLVMPLWRPLSSMAAALAIVALIGWIITQGGSPAMAAP